MALERSGYNRNQQQLYEECKKLMNYHIILTMSDGSMYDGIIVEEIGRASCRERV